MLVGRARGGSFLQRSGTAFSLQAVLLIGVELANSRFLGVFVGHNSV